MEAADELADLLEGERELALGGLEQLGHGFGLAFELPADQVQEQRDADEPLLRAVVEVALDPPPLGIAGGDDPRARLAHVADRGVQLRDVADDREHLARCGRSDPQLEVAQVAEVGAKPVVDRRELTGRESSRHAVHELLRDVRRKQLSCVGADHELGRVRKPGEVAAELEIGAVGTEPEQQVGQSFDERPMACFDRCGDRIHRRKRSALVGGFSPRAARRFSNRCGRARSAECGSPATTIRCPARPQHKAGHSGGRVAGRAHL